MQHFWFGNDAVHVHTIGNIVVKAYWEPFSVGDPSVPDVTPDVDGYHSRSSTHCPEGDLGSGFLCTIQVRIYFGEAKARL